MNGKPLIQLWLLCGFFFFVTNGYTQPKGKAQEVPDKIGSPKAIEAKLDNIFSSFTKSTPGVAVTVLQNGKVIAKKAYGLASLEHQALFTHNTVVHLPYSEGREFIAIAAALMAQQGFFSLQDKVRKFFPQLPAWSEPVTVYDLMNHRSGFVDEWATFLLAQASMTNRFDKSQFLDLLCRQPKPEVEPGKGYMYSNSDFGLLRLILEKASGQNLRDWMKSYVFDPLNMKATLLHDDKDEVIPGFSLTYYPFGKGYKTWTSDKTSPGGNYYIATTANDLQKWAAAHADTNSAIAKAVVKLFKEPQLMPGKDKDYVFGYKVKPLGNYEVFTHQGVNQRTYISNVKNKGVAVVLVSNTMAEYYPYHEQILSYLMGVKKPAFINKLFKKEKLQYTAGELKQFTGIYIEADTVTYESFTAKRTEFIELLLENDSLKMKFGKDIFPLEYVAWGVFRDLDYPAYLEFSRDKRDSNRLIAHIHGNNKVLELVKDNDRYWQPEKEELKTFAGKYYSPHLDIYWNIVLDDQNKLIVKRANIADTELDPHINKEFRIRIERFPGDSFNSWVKFWADEQRKVTHLTVHDPRLMHHRFDKVQ